MRKHIIFSTALTCSLLTSQCITTFAQTIQQDQTVYIQMDDSGQPVKTIVENHLEGTTNIQNDHSQLSQIKLLNGADTIEQNGQDILFTDGEKQIDYQGETTKTPPITYSFQYELNHREYTSKQIQDQNGHLKMQITFTNHTQEDDFIPFAMIFALPFDENTQNIQVNNGKVIKDGQKSWVIGFVLPDLQDQFHDLDLPTSITIEADVQNFKQPKLYGIASNDFFNDMDENQFDSITDMQQQLTTLLQATDQLTNGADTLNQGMQTFQTKSETLISAIHTLYLGAQKIQEGSSTFTNGYATFDQKLHQASQNANLQLTTNMDKLALGIHQTNQTISQQLPKLSQAIHTLNLAVADNDQKNLYMAIKQLNDGLQQLTNASSTFKSKAKEYQQAYSKLASSISQLNVQATTLSQSLQTQKQQLLDLSQKIAEIPDTTQIEITQDQLAIPTQIQASFTTDEQVETTINGAQLNASAIATLQQLLSSTNDDQIKQQLQQAITNLSNQQTIQVDLSNHQLTGTAVTNIQVQPQTFELPLTQIATLKQTLLTTLQGFEQTLQMLEEMPNAIEQIDQAASNDLYQATNQLTTNLQTTLPDSINTLAKGSDQIFDHFGQLSQQVNELDQAISGSNGFAPLASSTLNQLDQGANQLNQGTQALANGLQQLASASTTLNQGSQSLNNGIQQFHQGLQTMDQQTSPLANGIQQLAQGSKQLEDGLSTYQHEAIEPLTKTLNEKLIDQAKIAKKLILQSKKYTAFVDQENKNGHVQFIYLPSKN